MHQKDTQVIPIARIVIQNLHLEKSFRKRIILGTLERLQQQQPVVEKELKHSLAQYVNPQELKKFL